MNRVGRARPLRGATPAVARDAARVNPFEILSATEQASLYVLSQTGGQARIALSNALSTNQAARDFAAQCDAGNRFVASEATVFMGVLARQLELARENLQARGAPSQSLGALAALEQPIFIAEFLRDGVDYVARIYNPQGRSGTEIANSLQDLAAYCEGHHALRALGTTDNAENLDVLLARRFENLVSADVTRIPGLAGDTSNRVLKRRVELSSLLAGCVPFLNGSFMGDLGTDEINFGVPGRRLCNSQLRAIIRDWNERLRSSRGLQRTQGAGDVFTQRHAYDEPLNTLPYIAIEPMDRTMQRMLVLTVTPFDPWFIDDRVPKEMHLPTITLAVYDSAPAAAAAAQWSDRHTVQVAMRSALSSLCFRLMAQNRGDTLAMAAGEASNIARYWYSEGMAQLFDEDAERSGLDRAETVSFWERFVESILCADIEGINDIEVYPFDRAIIIQGAASNPPDSGGVTVSILETGLRGIAPEIQGRIQTSVDRADRDLGVDFDLTEKQIVHRCVYEVEPAEAGGSALLVSATDRSKSSGGQKKQFTLDTGVRTVPPGAEACLRILLDPDSADDAMTNALRRRFDDGGILYDYQGGVRLRQDFPMLSDLTKNHLAFTSMLSRGRSTSEAGIPKEDLDLAEGYLAKLEAVDSKVVVFSFDPSRSERNERRLHDGETSFFLGDENAVTMILIGDNDIEKSVQDINAEREDLRLLLSMIVRQKVQDKQKEFGILNNRLNTIKAVLEGVFHRIAGLPSDQPLGADVRSQIAQQWEGAKRLIEEEGLEDLEFQTVAELFAALLPEIHSTPPGGVDKVAAANVTQQVDVALRDRVKSLLIAFRANGTVPKGRKIEVVFAESAVPHTRMAIPYAAIRECFDVLLKNAVEACAMLPEEWSAKVVISAEVRPSEQDRSVLDIRVDNSYDRIPADTWAALTSRVPMKLDQNRRKQRTTGHSTGIGVYAARQLLKQGYGGDADISYEALGARMIRARMSLPCVTYDPELFANTGQDAQTPSEVIEAVQPAGCSAVLYVEDLEHIRTATLSRLAGVLPSDSILVADNASDARAILRDHRPYLFLSDIQIPATSESEGTESKQGRLLIQHYLFEVLANEDSDPGRIKPLCIVLSGDDPHKLVEHLSRCDWPNRPPVVEVVDVSVTSELPDADVVVLPSVKDFAGHEDLLGNIGRYYKALNSQEAKALRTPPADEPAHASPAQPSDLSEVPDRLISGKRTLSAQIKQVDANETDRAHFITIPGKSYAEAVVAWKTAPGLPDADLQGKHLFSLADTDYNRHLVGVVDLTDAPKSMSLNAWLLSQKIVSNSIPGLMEPGDWLRFPNESNGFSARLRHDVRNLRSVIAPELVKAIEDTTTSLEDRLTFDPKGDLNDLDPKNGAQFAVAIDELAQQRGAEQSADGGKATRVLLGELSGILARVTDHLETGNAPSLTRQALTLQKQLDTFITILTEVRKAS